MSKNNPIRLPKIKPFKSLFSNKVSIDAHHVIDEIVEELEVPKWMVIDKLICNSLGVYTPNELDLSKWIKKI